MEGTTPNLLSILVVLVAVGLTPVAIVTMTAFLKISIVLFLLRNALGVQQTPPTMVLYGVALILTAYISAPLVAQISAVLSDPIYDFESFEDWGRAAEAVSVPVRDHLMLYSTPAERAFLLDATAQLWPEEMQATVTEEDLLILIPAFVISELTRAFQIGFLLYLPFIAIDLVISAILLSMGMMMVPPVVISVPFKLFLFVLVEGWSRLLHGLLMSYA